jgi:DNA-binding MarR family transcriptional regulator
MVSFTTQQALEIWRVALVDGVRRDGPDLTARQLAVLLNVYLTPQPHTVRGLSAELGIAKPAVTRALDRLSSLDYLRRMPDPDDKRSIYLKRTVKGSVFLSDYGELVTASINRIAADQDKSSS